MGIWGALCDPPRAPPLRVSLGPRCAPVRLTTAANDAATKKTAIHIDTAKTNIRLTIAAR